VAELGNTNAVTTGILGAYLRGNVFIFYDLLTFYQFDDIMMILTLTGGKIMPIIRPSTDLRNRYNEISDLCHKQNEPIFITRNGSGDLAVMSIETLDRITGKFELYRLIERGLDDAKNGKVISLDESNKRIEALLGEEI
jgi:PHD/YefM family antitoxin component YafN of YafNO toxin-antitoxin module